MKKGEGKNKKKKKKKRGKKRKNKKERKKTSELRGYPGGYHEVALRWFHNHNAHALMFCSRQLLKQANNKPTSPISPTSHA